MKREKKYTIEEIKAYARHWLKPSLNFDALSVGEPENERLLTFIAYIDRKDDSDNFDNFLKKNGAHGLCELHSKKNK